MKLAQLKSLKTADQLAAQLGYSYATLSSLIYGPSAASSYRAFQIPKRSGGFRSITAPRSELKAIHREILEALTEAYRPTRSAFGFVRDRSIVGAAEPHVGRRVVVNVDLADFFPSISFWRVRGVFMSSAFAMPYDVATVLAQICCWNGRLPQGAPTSPIISNFVASALDKELGAYVGARGGRYSRYCDDMTMSFDSRAIVAQSIANRTSAGMVLNVAIENIIKKHGFAINPAKLKMREKQERQEVTGLVVNKKVNVRRELVKLLHTQMHCVDKFGLDLAALKYCQLSGRVPDGRASMHFAAAIRGRILFVKMVRGDGDAVFSKLARRFNRAGFYPKKIKHFNQVQSISALKQAVWVVEVGYDDPDWGFVASQGTAFLLDGIGFVTCAHVVVNDKSRRPFREIEVFRVGSITRYKAFVASFNPNDDLAVLYVEGIDYSNDCDVRFKLAPITGVVGQEVQMAGFPSYREGQSPFVSKTEVAAVHGKLLEVGGQVIGGISGGPLLDMQFRVVGVLTRGVLGGGTKNEAIKADRAFHLSFRFQNLDLLEAVRRPSVQIERQPGFYRRCLDWLLGLLNRVTGMRHNKKLQSRREKH